MAAKLTVHEDAAPAAEPPSRQLIRQAIKEEKIPVEDGRTLTVRKPGVLAQYRLIEAVGPEAAANQTYMQMINPLLYLGAIDDDPVHLPVSKREVEALIYRLDDDGLGALMAWYVGNVVAPTMDAIKAAEEAAALKN